MRGAAGEVEPTDDEVYEQRHRRPEYNEKRIVRRDRERAQFEVCPREGDGVVDAPILTILTTPPSHTL